MLADIIPKSNKPLSPEVLAYMAGIIDGEGSIALVRHPGNRIFRMEFVIVQSQSPKLPKWIQSHFGGRIDRIDNKHNHIWRWAAHPDVQANTLRHCLPYLVLKKRQAILLLYYYERCRQRSYFRLPEEIPIQRMRIWNALNRLHARKGRKRQCLQTSSSA